MIQAMPGEPSQRRATWLGHSTVLLELGGARLLTDPVLRPRVSMLRRHAPPASMPAGVDAVLISHLHRDHADLPTLRQLPAGTPVVAPAGSSRYLRGLDVREVDAGDAVEVAGVEVRAVPAEHGGARNPGARRLPALGFLAGGVYFAGDTDMFEDMRDFAPLAAALLPIWGWGAVLGPGHLNPEGAARALSLLRPRLVVPIHWGTLLAAGFGRRHAHLLREPVESFQAHVQRLAPEVEVRVPEVGVPIDLPADALYSESG
jgi:L-ascorbate metabolism protein UlaG (beta-lactamase superfamily)